MTISTLQLRSVLFVPGDRPDRFAKALASDADAICIDLEDAVAPEGKDAARAEVVAFLRDPSAAARARTIVRLNPLGSRDGLKDLLALGELASPPTLMLPKVEHPQTIADTLSALSSHNAPSIIALIETARGLRNAGSIAEAPDVSALALGPVDLAAELGARFDETALNSLRLSLKLAATEAGVALLDGPTLDLDDSEALSRSAEAAAALGLDGKLAIHPNQIAAINAAFTPTPKAVAWSRRVIDAAQGQAGVFRLDGRMIDKPVIDAARRLLFRAGAA
ncbi:HpcH/HpaI aldolase/citrate lyase family protein [Brevundimonas sp.]|uniref:HpcH/HpaI aldolase/citrate lyase family protein n=1 Tax=Brevundimonas sp. TaxID=1871086 RepID=UPI003D0C1B24